MKSKPKVRLKSKAKAKPLAKPSPKIVAKKTAVKKAKGLRATAAAPRFPAIQAILNRLVAGRSVARMQAAHGDPTFGWVTLAQLKGVVVRPNGPGTEPSYPLIDPSLVGNGKGAQTNLVIALANSTGVDFNGQMPLNGPYAAKADIQTIIDWINAGMPA
ncbi:MAG: hypothetical protein JF599_01135 [Verrucomicrobia bacterium]|nr:hypothetical protein [Verrucomicrobiota bacterium]